MKNAVAVAAVAAVAVLVAGLAAPVLAQEAPLPQPVSAHDRAEAENEQGREKVRVLDFSAAADHFRRAIELDSDPRYYFNLCFVLEKLGELAEARAACEVVVNARTDARLSGKARDRIESIDAVLAERPVTAAPGNVGEETGQTGVAEAPAPIAPFEEPEPRLRLGIVIGGASTTIDDDGVVGFDRKLGMVIGGRAIVHVAGPLSAVVELHLVNRGANLTLDDIILPSSSGSIDLNYLEVPLLARLSLGEDVRVFVEGGGAMALLVDDSFELGGEMGDSEVDGLDLSLVAGTGLEFETDWGFIGLSVRMWHGMRDLVDSGEQLRNRAVGVLGTASF